MSHLYLHIPFCQVKCPYCDFFSVATKKWRKEFVQALVRETEIRNGEIYVPIKTIYFGGGTPSLLTEQEFSDIISAIRKNYSIQPNAEITLEGNPDDITSEKIQFWKNQGVNRISIGIQSFSDNDLKYLGRRHNASCARQALNDIIHAGFENVSADLIHGIPGSDPRSVLKSIEEIKDIGVKHLSMYSLTVEKGTILDNRIRKGVWKNTDENYQAEMYLQTLEKAKECGFQQYEISNFCQSGFESKHNSSYWSGAPYLGLGPSAHSFDGNKRSWNVSDLPQYINGIADQKPVCESEILSENDKYNEFLLTRLRLICGVQFHEMTNLFGNNAVQDFKKNVVLLNAPQNFTITEDSLAISRAGLLYADRIISELMK